LFFFFYQHAISVLFLFLIVFALFLVFQINRRFARGNIVIKRIMDSVGYKSDNNADDDSDKDEEDALITKAELGVDVHSECGLPTVLGERSGSSDLPVPVAESGLVGVGAGPGTGTGTGIAVKGGHPDMNAKSLLNGESPVGGSSMSAVATDTNNSAGTSSSSSGSGSYSNSQPAPVTGGTGLGATGRLGTGAATGTSHGSSHSGGGMLKIRGVQTEIPSLTAAPTISGASLHVHSGLIGGTGTGTGGGSSLGLGGSKQSSPRPVIAANSAVLASTGSSTHTRLKTTHTGSSNQIGTSDVPAVPQ
jgi:hypothetical protein